MAICGHQFHGGDESDWILSTSANCLDGSTTATRILQELFKKRRQNMPNTKSRERNKTVIDVRENISPTKTSLETNRTSRSNQDLIVKKMSGVCTFEDFDESQHLNGCPMKWLYKKKLLEKNKMYKIERLCKKTVKNKEVKKEKCSNLRDKTPVEVKIHKINLTEKYTSNSEDPCSNLPPSLEKTEKDVESHRKKLAAKLNWKLHDESQDEGPFETSSEISSRHNYLPPRPLLGLKPLLSVLLAPQREARCCSLVALQDVSPRKKKVKASLSIQSLNLLISPPGSKPRPKTTNVQRWGSKSSPPNKKLQSAGQLADSKPRIVNSMNELKVVYYNPPTKKSNERPKQTKSLSSLFYELKGKTNYAYQNDQYFEELIRDLTMDEGQFKIKRFLNMSSVDLSAKGTKIVEPATPDDGELNLVCEKVRFFDKKPKVAKQEDERKARNNAKDSTDIKVQERKITHWCNTSVICVTTRTKARESFRSILTVRYLDLKDFYKWRKHPTKQFENYQRQ